jgi:sugar diacid utilization regulator
LDDVLLSLHVSTQAGWRFMVGSLTSTTAGADAGVAMAELPVVLVRFVAAVHAELVEGYHVSQLRPDQRRAEVLDSLLTGSFDDEHELLARARAVGLDLAGEHSVILLIGAGEAAEESVIRRSVTAMLPDALAVAMTSQPRPHLALLLPSATLADAGAQLAILARRHGVTALVASWRLRVGEVPGAYREARESTALAATVRPGRVVLMDELLADSCVQALPGLLQRALVERTLGSVLRLSRHDRDRLIGTLWSLHEHASQADAAAALGVHTHTVRRRCERVRALTGLDINRPADRFRLDLALHALRLSDAGSADHDIFSRSGAPSEPTSWYVGAPIAPAQRALPSPAVRSSNGRPTHTAADEASS